MNTIWQLRNTKSKTRVWWFIPRSKRKEGALLSFAEYEGMLRSEKKHNQYLVSSPLITQDSFCKPSHIIPRYY